MDSRLNIPMTRPLLDVTFGEETAKREYGAQIAMARDMAEYARQAILRLFEVSEHGTADVILLLMLFRQALAMFDGVTECLRGCAVHAAKAPLRALFEADLQFHWLTQRGTEEHFLRYHVAELRTERAWNKTAIPRTQQQRTFMDAMQPWAGQGAVPQVVGSPESAAKRNGEINRLLNTSKYRKANSLFASVARGRMKRQRKRRQWAPGSEDISWYRVASPWSLRNMARDLERLSHYDVIYRMCSDVVHGGGLHRQVAFQDGKVRALSIRSPEGFPEFFRLGVMLMFNTIDTAIRKYRPTDLTGLARTYRDEWRAAVVDIAEAEIEVRDILG